jgi:quinol monooxygenase YgiN
MITKILKFEVKPEASKSFKTVLSENKTGAAQEAGSVEMRIFVDRNNPNIFFSYERFTDEAAVNTHKEQPYTQKLIGLFDTALVSPPECLNMRDTVPAPVAVREQKQANQEDDVFVIFFIFKFKDGYRDKLLARFEEHITHTREEEGNLLFDLYTIDGQDDTLAVYEHWRKDSDVWDIHFKQPYSEITGALMGEAVVGDMEQYMNFAKEIA